MNQLFSLTPEITRLGVALQPNGAPCEAEGVLNPASTRDRQGRLIGTVNNVMFPTAVDPRVELGKRVFDVYYGMADYKIGLLHLTLR
ncbi:MAG: hypothetical protein K2W95_15145 [Candidatus Obscuribacterales bacterium]|nr:hypothetical protein [Candidatus Obscuribacterales bacterium]